MRKSTKATVVSLVMALAVTVSLAAPSFAAKIEVETGITQETEDGRETLPASFGMPSTFPEEGEHPRVMFTKEDLPDIRKNMSSSEGAFAAAEFKKLLAIDTDGILPDKLTGVGSNMDYKVFAVIEAYAFDYVLSGNIENGEKAVEAAKNIIKTFKYNPNKSDIVREKGVVIYLSALVYDWCHPLMTDSDKKLFVDNTEKLAATITGMGGWPPTKVYAVHGHNSETHIQRDLLAFSIASYDEYPDIYNLIGGYVMNGLVETKNYWYESGSFHQGLGYTPLRFSCELTSQFLFHRMNGTKLYSDDMGKVPYMLYYNNRPDGRSFTEGDTNGDSLSEKIPTWTRGDMTHLLYASSIWDDGYLKSEYEKSSKNNTFLSYSSFWPLLTPVNFLIVNDPNVESLPKEDLPRTRLFGSPNGLMVARTGLSEGVNSSDAIAWAKIGETYVGNHAHLDSGSFQIYYKGPLAWDFGAYDSYGSEHDSNYAKETISHNSLLIYDPDEVMTTETTVPAAKNSGGMQRRGKETLNLADLTAPERHMADILGMEYGENPIEPEYSYISGDLAPGYSDKVSEVRRSMMFMPTGNEEKPAIFVVMDKVISSNPAFKKSFLIHSLQEPSVEGNVTTIVRDTIGYNGKLTMQTLYPQNPVIEKVGGLGKQFWVVDKNYPPKGGKYHADYDSDKSSEFGWGRVEISPSTESTEDYFLNVMYVSDADNLSPVDQADLIETTDLLGARILDKVTLFGKDRERISHSISFRIPGTGEVAVTVAGISKGEWKIKDANGLTQTKEATQEGGVVYFTGIAGEYTMQLTDPDAPVEVQEVKDLVNQLVDQIDGLGNDADLSSDEIQNEVKTAVKKLTKVDIKDLAAFAMDEVLALEDLYIRANEAVGNDIFSSIDLSEDLADIIDNVDISGAALSLPVATPSDGTNIGVTGVNAALEIEKSSSSNAIPEQITFNKKEIQLDKKNGILLELKLNLKNESKEVIFKNIQPKAPILVTMPIPSTLDEGKDIFVLHYNDDGKPEIQLAKVKDGKLIFIITKLSDFAIVTNYVKDQEPPANPDPPVVKPSDKNDNESFASKSSGAWVKDDKGWWYRRANGSWSTNNWEKIGGKWYYFDEKGYMKTGWINSSGRWYYLLSNGQMVVNDWVYSQGKSYYMAGDGGMLANQWLSHNDIWYLVGNNGVAEEKQNY